MKYYIKLKKFISTWPDTWVWPLIIGLFMALDRWGNSIVPGLGAFSADQIHAIVIASMWFIVGAGLCFGFFRFQILFLHRYYEKHNDGDEKHIPGNVNIINDFKKLEPWQRLLFTFSLLCFLLFIWTQIHATVVVTYR